jgi:hypothetical protein
MARLWGIANLILETVKGDKNNQPSGLKGPTLSTKDICEKPAEGIKYENCYKKIYPLGGGVCGCHYPREKVFHEELGPMGNFDQYSSGSSGPATRSGGCVTHHQCYKCGYGSDTQGVRQDRNLNALYKTSGNDGNDSSVIQGGGEYCDRCGNGAEFGSGTKTGGNAQNIGWFTPGKCTINAEKGVGFGVNSNENQNVWMRMEPDGTFNLQVKPAGSDGGAARIKITPDGTVKIISEKEVTIESAGKMNIKANKLNVDAASTEWKGNIDQIGVHKDSRGFHS